MNNRIACGGVCVVILAFAATPAVSTAQTFTTLLSFDGTNGASPGYMSLAQGVDGDLYGTTLYGGTNTFGTVFKVTPAGLLTTLHNFNDSDGALPYAGLILATDGYFYGAAERGGKHHNGTVFKITPAGDLTTLHSFDALDGANPFDALAQGADGSLYGTTDADGASGFGTIFTITPQGNLTTLHSFDDSDGRSPGGLAPLYNGNLIGTTSGGGTPGYGTIFTITPQGTLTTLESFDNSDGAYPGPGLTPPNGGYLYGTTSAGGTKGYGSVFKITTQGVLTTIYNFQGTTEGASTLVQATNGNLYGTTFSDADGYGTLFEITPSGAFTTLYTFAGANTDGTYPSGGLLQSTDGNLYGTTNEGGAVGHGTLYRFSIGLGPFVKTLPASGKVGAAIQILGTDLTGATSVTFNGTTAAFTLVSPTLITATVPTGATSGQVRVATPGGTLLSNVAFGVR